VRSVTTSSRVSPATNGSRVSPAVGPALILACLLFCLFTLTATPGAAGSLTGTNATTDENADPRITGIYPNPVADDDRGEFVVLSVPSGTDLGEFSLADDDGTVTLPNRTVDGRVVLSTHPNVTAPLIDAGPGVHRLPETFALANGGERLVLGREDRVVDSVTYANAPPGEMFVAPGGHWRPLGATERPVVAAGPGRVRVFVLPDTPDVVVETLRDADRRVLVAGYTFTSRRVTDALVAASARNVTVRVLVDGAPVGGLERAESRRLDRLVAAGVEVRALGGERARYAFHHAKYAVVDDRALVTTENWKPSGTGGHDSRGWGAVTRQPAVVRGLVDTFRADAGWRDAIPWREYRQRVNTTAGGRASEEYPSRFDSRRVRAESARLLVAPDNAERAVAGLIRNATDSVRIEQVSIGGRGQPFVRATLDAARRGVRVRVLVSGAWYARKDNRNLTQWLNERARREGLDLEARVADPRGRFGKIHAKGLVVDGDRAIVGSLNWNNHSARENREVALVLHGEEPARYFTRVFRADWRGGLWTLPAGLGLACLVATVCAVWRARRIRFAPSS
jgi:phosphatidylserine/phosphatidylglycerophosphate/cardiolipin synthase-like enzyme